MLTPGRLFRRVRAWLRRSSLDAEMDEEIEFHLQMEADDAVRRGASPEDARTRARIDFGGVQRFREEGRDARGARLLDELGSDVRYAVRVLRRAPAFTLVAVLTLALGIGANSAIFSVVNAVVLRPLPFADEGTLVSVWDGGHSRAEYLAVRERTQTLSSISAYMSGWDVTLGGPDGEPERVNTALVTAGFFNTLGVIPAHGRFFVEGEDKPGSEPVVVMSDELWRRRFGADPAVVGRTIDLDGVARRVVGVAPAELRFPGPADRLWVPLEVNPAEPGPHWGGYGHHLIGRLRAGASAGQAQEELTRLARQLAVENPVWKPGADYVQGITVTPLRERVVSGSRRLLYLLFGAVGLVLLIACANVANLLIVRGAARERELAIRATLGAGTRRLARQLVTESLVVATAGGLAGLGIALAGTRVITGLLPPSTPRLGDVRLDGAVVVFTAVLALSTGLAFGLLPARRLARDHSGAASPGHRASAGPRQRRLAGALVSAQISLAMVLVIGAALLVRSMTRLLDIDPGFETGRVVTARVSPPRASYETDASQRALASRLLERLQGIPGLEGVAFTTQLPFEPRNEVMAMWVDGWTTDPNKLELFEVRRVSPDFFRVMGIPVRRGRGLLTSDDESAVPVAVVSESAERRFWPGRDATEGQVRFPWPGWMRVVGVVADVRNNDLRKAALPTLYLPYAQDPRALFTLVARTSGPPRQALAMMRGAVQSLAKDVAVSDEQVMAQLVERSVAAPRSMSLMLLSFGALALLLGGIGTYGLVAYGVECRRQEFAVRLAVGAGRGRLVRLVLGEGLRLTAIGVAIGLAAALALTRLLEGLLFEIAATDALSFTVAPVVLVVVALVACAIPAWRATRVDPIGPLRGAG